MGQPTPPGDLPLIEGLDSSWNDIVSAFPEERRAELGPILKDRISAFEPLKAYEDFHKSGITPDQINTSLNIHSIIEKNPREVYETLGKHLGITAEQAQEVVEELDETDSDDPRIAQLKNQVDTLTQIALAQRQQTTAEQIAAENDARLDSEIAAVKKKYGDDIPEDQLLMRMLHKDMTAEQAYQDYSTFVDEVRKRRPAPMIMGAGGTIPAKAIDPKKLNSVETKNLVSQMLEHANQAAKS
jgi:hypothetical protein